MENFTASLPSNAQVVCEADFKDPKVGLGCGKITYHLNPKTHVASLDLGDEHRSLTGPGILKMWVKGDNSQNELELVIRYGKVAASADNHSPASTQTEIALPRVKLDFDGWREVTFDAHAVPEGVTGWLQRLNVQGPQNPGNTDGTIWVDDLRQFPDTNSPAATCSIGLIGPAVREFGTSVALFLDVRNFSDKPAKIHARITMTDRNENAAADREFDVELAPQESKEVRLDMAPENLAALLPPFKITGDVLSSELQDLSTRVDTTLVMGNSRFLFSNCGDVFDDWFTAGSPVQPGERGWIDWTFGEAQRATPLVQTTARISRVEVP
ncbi:MAG: hypothetical protein WCD79_14820, partial [Chthoniobacteraceae bacterium]